MDVNNNRALTDVLITKEALPDVLAMVPRSVLEDSVRPIIEYFSTIGLIRTENLFELASCKHASGVLAPARGSDFRLPNGQLVEVKTATSKDITSGKQGQYSGKNQTATVKLSGPKKDSDWFMITVNVINKVDDPDEKKSQLLYYVIPKAAAYTKVGKFRKSFDFKFTKTGFASGDCKYVNYCFGSLVAAGERLKEVGSK